MQYSEATMSAPLIKGSVLNGPVLEPILLILRLQQHVPVSRLQCLAERCFNPVEQLNQLHFDDFPKWQLRQLVVFSEDVIHLYVPWFWELAVKATSPPFSKVWPWGLVTQERCALGMDSLLIRCTLFLSSVPRKFPGFLAPALLFLPIVSIIFCLENISAWRQPLWHAGFYYIWLGIVLESQYRVLTYSFWCIFQRHWIPVQIFFNC